MKISVFNDGNICYWVDYSKRIDCEYVKDLNVDECRALQKWVAVMENKKIKYKEQFKEENVEDEEGNITKIKKSLWKHTDKLLETTEIL